MHHNLQEGHLMYQVAAWGDARSSTKWAMPDASSTIYSCTGVDHNLWDSRLMHQVIVCGNARCSGTSMLMLRCITYNLQLCVWKVLSLVCGTGV